VGQLLPAPNLACQILGVRKWRVVTVTPHALESEHYEIAVDETLLTNAQARGATEVAELLRHNLEQEKHALEVARSSMKTIAEQGIAAGAVA
jgi:ferritin-like metal-binding protein YciE